MSPTKAITDIYKVTDSPTFDPWTAWDGFWIDLEKISTINDITFAEMKKDPILSKWGVIGCQFQGTITEPIPAAIYNRLLQKIPTAIRDEHKLIPEPVATTATSGQFTSEAQFEEAVIIPLIKQWGFQYRAQFPCSFYYGTQHQLCWVDFFITDGGTPLTLFEDKLRILNQKELSLAVNQAKSYALMLGLSSFVIASPEGIWVYSLNKNKERLETKLTSDELKDHHDEIKQVILKLK